MQIKNRICLYQSHGPAANNGLEDKRRLQCLRLRQVLRLRRRLTGLPGVLFGSDSSETGLYLWGHVCVKRVFLT